jgi:very-short-patch-repair endonuclease
MMQFKNWQEKVSSTNIEFIGVTEPSQLKKILFESPNNNIEFKCNNCGSVESLPSETVKWRLKNLKTICTKCSGISIGSAAQLNVINFIKEHYHGEIIVNYKRLIHPYELDIYIPGLKLAIEYDGLFWHSHCSMESKDEREYHLRKTEQCEKHGIQLIHIFENEWVLKTDIVKSRIKHLLGVSDCIIYARKCKVIEISSLDSKDFLDKNHIQGNCQASVKLGMYHQSKLVAVMTFGKSRFNKKYEWELLRYSSACNCSVVGGAGKLISYFKKSYTPRNVISFADRRWSLGKLYKKLGFDFLHDSAPNFWYWKKNGLHLESRIKYQKYKLKDLLKNYDESMSASTNMFSNGFRRIWDCGNKVYALNL